MTEQQTNEQTAPADDAETFPRAYVERLREESAGYRTRAQRADEATSRLTQSVVREATADLLADPADLLLSDELLTDGWPDPEKVRAAAEVLVATKPHFRKVVTNPDVGQGPRREDEGVSLAALLRAGAG